MYKQEKNSTVNLKAVLILTLSMVLFTFGAVQAQEDSQGGMEQAPVEVTQAEVNNFAKALNGIQDVQEAYTREAQGIENDADIRDLQKKYQDKMIQTVKNQGLTVKRYNEISQAMQKDEELSKKVRDKASQLN